MPEITTTKISPDSLDEDYIVEKIVTSDAEGEEELKVKKVKTANPPAAFKSRHSFNELGFQFAELPSQHRIPTYTLLLQKLYLDKPKPLVVKNHTKIKVLIVCSSALRVLEIVKELRDTDKLSIIKLFARHMKETFHVGVGTPNRIMKVLEADENAIKRDKIEMIILDGSHKDKKTMTILDLDNVRKDLASLHDMFKDTPVEFYNF